MAEKSPRTIDLTKHPTEVARALKKLSDDAKSKYVTGWCENIENLSGFLTDSTQSAMRSITNGEYADYWESSNSHGTITVANRIMPAILRMDARILGMISGFQGIPATADEKDKDAAKAFAKLLQAIWYNDHLYEDFIQATNLAFCCSHAYIFVEADESAEYSRTKIRHPAIAAPFVDVYPGIKRLSDSPVIAIHEPMTEQDVLRRWGKVPDSPQWWNHDQTKLAKLEMETDKVQLEIVRLYYRPCKKDGWEFGKHYVLNGDEVLHQTTNDDGDDWLGVGDPDKPETLEYPLIDFSDVPLHYGYWGRGRQSAVRGPQKIVNMAWSKCAQAASLPGLIIGIPYGSKIGTEEISNTPVQTIKYNPVGGRGVDFFTPPRQPAYEYIIEKGSQWIDEIYHQPGPSRGESPGSRFSAKGLEFLTDQAELGDSPLGRMIMEAASNTARHVGIEGQRVWSEQMIDYIVGDNGIWERIEFQKANLADGWDIRVMPDTGLPQSRAARMSAVTSMAQFGLINVQDQKERREARKMVRAFTDDDAYDPARAQEAIAKTENQQLLAGNLVAIRPYDDDEAHSKTHLDGVLAAKNRNQLSQEGEAAVIAHMQAHMERLAAGTAQAQVGEAPMPGPQGVVGPDMGATG